MGVLRGSERAVTHVEFSPDGKWVITANSDGTARLSVTDFDELLAIAESRLPKNLRGDNERRRFIER